MRETSAAGRGVRGDAEAVTLDCAPGPPRAMRASTNVVIALGAAGAAIVAAGYVYRTTRAVPMVTPGEMAPPRIQWQPRAAGAQQSTTQEEGGDAAER